MTDDISRWIKERIEGNSKRIDVISWGNERGWHDHEVAKFHKDGDIDYYKFTNRDKQKQR